MRAFARRWGRGTVSDTRANKVGNLRSLEQKRSKVARSSWKGNWKAISGYFLGNKDFV